MSRTLLPAGPRWSSSSHRIVTQGRAETLRAQIHCHHHGPLLPPVPGEPFQGGRYSRCPTCSQQKNDVMRPMFERNADQIASERVRTREDPRDMWVSQGFSS
jgi:hypothetical protein